MSYTFEILGVTPVITFFNYQQEVEKNPHRSKAYLASYECTLDSFIKSTEMIPQKPEWDWDEVINTMVNFWLKNSDSVQHWQIELKNFSEKNLIIARVANVNVLRQEFESLFFD